MASNTLIPSFPFIFISKVRFDSYGLAEILRICLSVISSYLPAGVIVTHGVFLVSISYSTLAVTSMP